MYLVMPCVYVLSHAMYIYFWVMPCVYVFESYHVNMYLSNAMCICIWVMSCVYVFSYAMCICTESCHVYMYLSHALCICICHAMCICIWVIPCVYVLWTAFMAYINMEDQDQTANPCSLISAFSVHLQNTRNYHIHVDSDANGIWTKNDVPFTSGRVT